MTRRLRAAEPTGLLDDASRRAWHSKRAAVAVFIAIVSLPTFGLVAVNHVVRADLRQRARAANQEVSDQMAGTIEQAINERARLVSDAVLRPAFALGGGTDSSFVTEALSVLAADGNFCDVRVQGPAGKLFSAGTSPRCAPDTGAATIGPDGVGHLPTQVVGGLALTGTQITLPVARGATATLRATYSLSGIAEPSRPQTGGTVSVVGDTGTILQSSNPAQVGLTARAPAFLTLVKSHRAGSADVYAPNSGQTVLFAYRPIPGTVFGVSSSVPNAVAYATADTLQRQLVLGYLAFLILAAGAAVGASQVLRRQERARVAASRRATGLAETSPDGIMVIDTERRVVYANRSLASMVGIGAPAEMIGQPVETWTTTESYSPHGEEPGDGRRLVSLEHRDGTSVAVEVNTAPFDLDGRIGKLIVIRDMTERHRVERALAAAEGRQRAILDTIPDGVVLYDVADGRPVPVLTNPAARALLGVGGDDLRVWRSMRGVQIVDEHGAPMDDAAMSVMRVVDSGERLDGLVTGIRRDATTTWIRSSSRPIFDEHGSMTGIVTCLVDITEEQAAHAEVAAAHARYAALVEHGSDLISVSDCDGRLRYLSPAHERVLGWDQSWLGRTAHSAFHPDDQAAAQRTLAHLIADPSSVVRLRSRVKSGAGDWRHLDITYSNRLGDPWVNGLVTNSRDVTEEVAASELLRHQATHDPLTGLANRTLLLERLEQAPPGQGALLFIDLDHFKRVNDTLGHAAGDALLVAISGRLQQVLRPGDSVARVGGDEFVVLANWIDSVETAAALAARIRDAVTQPVRLAARTVTVGCSVGIALAGNQRPETLLQEADTALYEAKQRGRNRSEMYDTAMRVSTLQRLDEEVLLRSAMDNDRLAVVFQPVVNLATGQPIGTEALVRVRDLDGSLIEPDRFIRAAEDSGLIVPLGTAVLEMACAQQARWVVARTPLAQVAVNLSGRQLAEPDLVSHVASILSTYGLSPQHLCLELTESSLIDGDDTTLEAITALKAMGVTLALDDFGTGWSSLAYLRRFPIDIIKIDRSFVAGLGTTRGDTEVVRAIVGLGRALGLTTVAEGVETPAQAQQLILLGCQHAQGYFFGRPVAADMVEVVLEQVHGTRMSHPPSLTLVMPQA